MVVVMKKELNYVAPDLEVIEVMVEAGFANSRAVGGSTTDWDMDSEDQTSGWN